jgi:hypothetical protein
MKTHDVLVDSGVLISLTSSCLDDLLYFFKKHFGLRFIIPPSVEDEAVSRPMRSGFRKYLFSAVRIKDAIDDGVIVVAEAKISDKTRRIMYAANNLFYIRGKPLRLIQLGESEMLALALELDIEYILIDERTTRMLIEAPFRLKEHLQEEFGVNVMIDKKKLKELSSMISPLRALRSSELVMLAHENGYFRHFKKLQRKAIEAALYKVRFSGCSIRFDEIEEYMSWVD